MKFLTGASLTVIAFVIPPAWAQTSSATPQQAPVAAPGGPDSSGSDGTADIIVTANRRSENLQRVAASISAVSGESLSRQGITQLDDALKNVAGVSIAQSPTGLAPTIRGIGPSVPNNLGGDNGVSTTFDGVYNQADIASRAGYNDVSRIEVLRGPQGTLYGRNAEGGAVNIISNNPTQRLEAAASADIGNYSLLHFTGMANVPLSDDLAIRITGSTISRDGYLSNGQDDNQATNVRVKALYKPSDGFSLLVGGEYTKIGGNGQGVVTAFTTAPDANDAYRSGDPLNQSFQRHGYKVWSQVDADIGIGTLTVLPAYQWLSAPRQFTYTGLNKVSAPGDGALEQKSVEARLASKSGSPFEWIVGAYYYDNSDTANNVRTTALDANGNIIVTAAAPRSAAYTARSRAIFAQVKVPIGESLHIIGGLRQSWDKKSQLVSSESTIGSGVDFSHLDWKVGAEFDASRNSLLYATVATGYRPGGLSPQSNRGTIGTLVGATFPAYPEETLTSYEVGSKNQLFDRKLRLNLSGYYYDYKNYQLPNLVFIPPAVNLEIVSLPKVEVYGAELEAQFVPDTGDRFSVAVSYMLSNIKSPQLLTFPPPAVQLQGEELPNDPHWRLSSTYEHDFVFTGGARLTPSVTVRYSDPYYVTIPRNAFSQQNSYFQEDASLGFVPANGHWSLTAYIKNLSDEVVKSNFIGRQLTLASPRTYGVVLSAKF